MPILPRSTVIDRPTLVDREEDGDNQTEQSDGEVIEELGEGDGPVINGIRFSKGDYGVVAASNLVSILSTAQTEGPEFKQAFMTAAIQIKEMSESGIDVSRLARMGRDRGVDDINVTESQLQELKLATNTEDIQEVEEDVEEVSEDDKESADEEAEESDTEQDEDVEEVDDSDEDDEEESSIQDVFEDDNEEQDG